MNETPFGKFRAATPATATDDEAESVSETDARDAFGQFRPAAPATPPATAGEVANPFGTFKPAPASQATSSPPPATPAASAPAGSPFGQFTRSPAAPAAPRPPALPAKPPPATTAPAAPAAGFSLDLDAQLAQPPAAPPAPAPVPAVSGAGAFDLNLFSDDRAPATVVAATATVDVASHAAAAAAAPGRPGGPPHRALPVVLTETPPLAAGSAPVLGQSGTPAVVALSRAQSGIGTIEFTIASPSRGRMRLGLIAEYSDGVQAVIGPANEAFPVATIQPGGEALLNLRRVRELRRALVYVTAKSPETSWQGMVTATLAPGTKAHASIAYQHAAENTVVFSILVVDGRIVLRAEADHGDRPLREIARRYGYSRVAWVDDRTSVGCN